MRRGGWPGACGTSACRTCTNAWPWSCCCRGWPCSSCWTSRLSSGSWTPMPSGTSAPSPFTSFSSGGCLSLPSTHLLCALPFRLLRGLCAPVTPHQASLPAPRPPAPRGRSQSCPLTQWAPPSALSFLEDDSLYLLKESEAKVKLD